jgi:hypothetical protein
MILNKPDKQYLKNTFQATAQNPDAWRIKASVLKKTANLVLDQMKADEGASRVEAGWVDPVYKYLAGITIENLLKGIIIADHGKDLITKREIDSKFARHRTWTKHADNKLKFLQDQVTDDQKTLMRILEHYVVWKGRYPVATSAEHYANDTDDVEKVHLSLEKLESDFNTLFETLHKVLFDKANTYIATHNNLPWFPM